MVTYAVELENVSKHYGSYEVLKDVTLRIRKSEFFSILGPSGSGKTTIIKIIAGLVSPDRGCVKFNGEDCTNKPPYKRNIGMVFQDLALFPHLNVYDNVAYGLRIRKVDEREIREKVFKYLELVNLDPKIYAKRKINQLSGGQQQRVAIARALITEPSVLLLDEPLGALDFKVRQHMAMELKRIQKTVGTTFIYVTHDQSEALTLSDRIAVINSGKIEQIGTPQEIYEKPATRFVASFIGEMNFISARVENGEVLSEIGKVRVNKLNGSREFLISIRPEKVRINDSAENSFEAVVEEVNYFGSHLLLKLKVGNSYLKALAPSSFRIKEAEKVVAGWNSEDAILLEA